MNRDVGETIRFGGDGGDVVVTDSTVFVFGKTIQVSTLAGAIESVSSEDVVLQKASQPLLKLFVASLAVAAVSIMAGAGVWPNVNNYYQLTDAEQMQYTIARILVGFGVISGAVCVFSLNAFGKSEKRVKRPLYVVTLQLPFGHTLPVRFVDLNRAAQFLRAVQAVITDLRTKPMTPQVLEVRHIEMAVQKQRCLYCETMYPASMHRCPNCAAPAKLAKARAT